jgi:hypothetical protein
MTNEVGLVIALAAGWREVVAAPAASFLGPHHLTLYDAKNATIEFMTGNLSAIDATRWANFLLALPCLELEPRVADELSEFLAEWSSASTIEITEDTVDVWQSRMSLAEI